MSKKLLLTLILSLTFLIHSKAQELTPEMQEFIDKIDGATLDDLEKELSEGIKGLKLFADFVNAPEEEPKTVTKENEKYSAPFKIDTSEIKLASRQFNNMGFTQSFKNDKSNIKFKKIGDDYWNRVSFSEGINEWFTPKKIYYKDGKTHIIKLFGCQFNF